MIPAQRMTGVRGGSLRIPAGPQPLVPPPFTQPRSLPASPPARAMLPTVVLTLAAALSLAVILSAQAAAQTWTYPETRAPLATLDRTRGMEAGVLRSVLFTAEASHELLRRDRDLRWNVAAGGALELAGGREWNLQFETVADLAVDPLNSIAFNPRAFLWYEALLVSVTGGRSSIWQFGYVHRCKHDVDNLELYETTDRYEQRSLILGSVMVRRSDVLRMSAAPDAPVLRVTGQADLYILLQDQRFPVMTRIVRPTLESMLGSLRGAVALELPFGPDVSVGAAIDVRASLRGAVPGTNASRFDAVDAVPVDGSVEAWAQLHGAAGRLRLFLRCEALHDSFIPPVPRASTLLLAGLRLLPS